MTNKKILQLIKKHRPTNVEELKELGISADWVDEGCFRKSYYLGSKLLIKFPYEDDGDLIASIVHSRNEIKTIKKLARYKVLRPLLPKIYYYDKETGVIVMAYYEEGEDATESGNLYECWRVISKLINKIAGIKLGDLGGSNCCFTGKFGTSPKILDFGL